MENQSQRIICCGAKLWALWIGCIQMLPIMTPLSLASPVTCGISVGAFSVYITLFWLIIRDHDTYADAESDDKHFEEDDELDIFVNGMLGLSVSIFGTIISLWGFFSGIILIMGVKQKNSTKLKVWTAMEILFLAISLIFLAIEATTGNVLILIADLMTMLYNVFCIWVVSIHREEIVMECVERSDAAAGRISQEKHKPLLNLRSV